jgi:hypothetical protein
VLACLPLVVALAAAPAEGERTKLVVLDLVGDAVSENVRKSLAGKIATRFAEDERLDVLSGDDIRGMATFEADKQASGCDDSCLAELAGAMNARLVASGYVGRLGSLYVVNLSVFDAQAARAVARANVEAERVEDLGAKVESAVDAMRKSLPIAKAKRARKGGPPVLPLALTAGGGVGFVVGAVALGIGGALFAGQQSARGELDSSADAYDASESGAGDDLAAKNEAYADAREIYSTIGVPLVVGGALVAAAGATVAIVGAALFATAGDAE